VNILGIPSSGQSPKKMFLPVALVISFEQNEVVRPAALFDSIYTRILGDSFLRNNNGGPVCAFLDYDPDTASGLPGLTAKQSSYC